MSEWVMIDIVFEKAVYRVAVSCHYILQDVFDTLKIKYTANVCYCPTKGFNQMHNQIGAIGLEHNDVVIVI